MRILYCIDLLECKYVSEVSEIWIYAEDIKLRYAKISFLDYCDSTYVSEKMEYDRVLNCLEAILKDGYLDLSDIIFEREDDE